MQVNRSLYGMKTSVNYKIIRENTVEVLLNTMKHWKLSLSLLLSPLKIFCEDPVAVNDKVQILQSKNIDYESTQTTTDTHSLSQHTLTPFWQKTLCSLLTWCNDRMPFISQINQVNWKGPSSVTTSLNWYCSSERFSLN